jgi:4-amino-4-deoxy-L-arabinose transferase-like glycosyltransferase
MATAVALFALAGFATLLGFKFTQDVFVDNAEAYAWGRQFMAGYGRHPPLTGWIAGLWYGVFPAQDWASYLLSRLMTAIALFSIWLLARRVLDARRAALIAFAMMIYPIFFGAKSDRFNNYQVLLAFTPLLIWLFLLACDRATAWMGVALGLAAAAVALTIYSSALVLIGIALTMLVQRERRRLFATPMPYVTVATFLVAVSPHLAWLIARDFPPLRWAGGQFEQPVETFEAVHYFGHQTGLIGVAVLSAALAISPWRLKRSGPPSARSSDRRAVLMIAAIMLFVPPVAALLLGLRLKLEWGDALFFIVPIALAILMPRLLVTRLGVARAALIAIVVVAAQLVASPFISVSTFKSKPMFRAYIPTAELAAAVTRLWRERLHSPLPIVLGSFEVAAPIVFYSSDHPRMFADSPDPPRVFAADQPWFSPWIDYPADLRRLGFVGVCHDHDRECVDYLARLDPGA